MTTTQNTIEDVLRVVGSSYGVGRAELLSHARTRRLHRPRQIAIYLSGLVSGAAPGRIGALFGGRDETIIRMHCRAIARACRNDRDMLRVVEMLEKSVRSR